MYESKSKHEICVLFMSPRVSTPPLPIQRDRQHWYGVLWTACKFNEKCFSIGRPMSIINMGKRLIKRGNKNAENQV